MPYHILFGRLLPTDGLLEGRGHAETGLLRVLVRAAHLPAVRVRAEGRAQRRTRETRRAALLPQRW